MDATRAKVIILGATGMLGNAMLRYLASAPELEVWGTSRSTGVDRLFTGEIAGRVIENVDVMNGDSVATLIAEVAPQIIINCVGVVKQIAASRDVLASVPINSLLPHRLARLCQIAGARLIHFSTDCVFSGKQGNYRESDPSDAPDVYGISKFLGEVTDPHTITLRTSMVGRELISRRSLLDWFLAQKGAVKGYQSAIFSGLTTLELARIVREYVIPRPQLFGLYHVSAEPISKLDLLKLFADVYEHPVENVADDTVTMDRSLNSDLFRNATNYRPPPWPDLIAELRRFN